MNAVPISTTRRRRNKSGRAMSLMSSISLIPLPLALLLFASLGGLWVDAFSPPSGLLFVPSSFASLKPTRSSPHTARGLGTGSSCSTACISRGFTPFLASDKRIRIHKHILRNEQTNRIRQWHSHYWRIFSTISNLEDASTLEEEKEEDGRHEENGTNASDKLKENLGEKNEGLEIKNEKEGLEENEDSEVTEEDLEQALEYLASLIKNRLGYVRQMKQSKETTNAGESNHHSQGDSAISDVDSANSGGSENEKGSSEATSHDSNEDVAYRLAKGRFLDLSTTLKGEHILEQLFLGSLPSSPPTSDGTISDVASEAVQAAQAVEVVDGMQSQESHQTNEPTPTSNPTTPTTPSSRQILQIKLAITTLQSLLLYATQVGIKGPSEQHSKLVRHLFRRGEDPLVFPEVILAGKEGGGKVGKTNNSAGGAYFGGVWQGRQPGGKAGKASRHPPNPLHGGRRGPNAKNVRGGQSQSETSLYPSDSFDSNSSSTSQTSQPTSESTNKNQWWIHPWTPESSTNHIRRLKFHSLTHPAIPTLAKRILATLVRKRTAQGAMELLMEMGVWSKHEDMALLRSGFPIRFLGVEEEIGRLAETNERDPDTILGIRKDLRHLKVYTIDNASTLDIDDGISVEVLNEDGTEDTSTMYYSPPPTEKRLRYWVHIADVDRWAPRGSELLKVAERRGTSLYLPTDTFCMFPENMSANIMSLTTTSPKHALSLSVELNADGSLDPSTLTLTPTLLDVDYRLTYDQVDEMLDEGVGYTEEWEIGALLEAATKRRAYRVGRGSTEGLVPWPIPRGMVEAKRRGNDDGSDVVDYDEYDISIDIETTHNSGVNMTTMDGGQGGDDNDDPYASPVSSSHLIVTEMMILAGEAIGKWQEMQHMQEKTHVDGCLQLPNILKLPYRRQPAPDFKTRAAESRHMSFLLAMNQRYPHAWYARRFFNPVSVSEDPGPHFGMGLDCYVQWTSPIRRMTDLQVHSSLKRFLRRKKVNEMLLSRRSIPSDISSVDLGYDISVLKEPDFSPANTNVGDIIEPVDPIDYSSALGMIFAARPIQTSSSSYWMLEYIRQLVEQSDKEVMFESVILGCVNKERHQYAIYVYELGLEHKYLSETGKLDDGRKLWLKVASVNPRMDLLTFSLASRSGGIHSHPAAAAA